MKIAIASGKGGTGKTTVCASLTSIWKQKLLVIDLDVEEPNLHLFLKPKILKTIKATIEIPIVNEKLCKFCEKCSNICQFNAISVINKSKSINVFPEMCHGCGGCFLICPFNCIEKGERILGEILCGSINDINFIMGQLRISEAMSPPLINNIKQIVSKSYNKEQDILIDAPPGTSCPAINAVMDSDLIILVTEPTPFGFHDLKLVREAFNYLDKPMGVVINRAGIGNNEVYNYCKKTKLPILAEIPFDIKIAEQYANGKIITEISKDYKNLFISLKNKILNYA